MTEYKGFSIETYEDRPGLFKAALRGAKGEHVRVTDGGMIGAYTPVATTLEFATAATAIAEAKKIVDRHGIEVQPRAEDVGPARTK